MPAIPSRLPPVNPNASNQSQKVRPLEIDDVLLFGCSNDEALQADDGAHWEALRARIKPINSFLPKDR